MDATTCRLFPAISFPRILFPGQSIAWSGSPHPGPLVLLPPANTPSFGSLLVFPANERTTPARCLGRVAIDHLWLHRDGSWLVLAREIIDHPHPDDQRAARRALACLRSMADSQDMTLDFPALHHLDPEALSFLLAATHLLNHEDQLACLGATSPAERLKIVIDASRRILPATFSRSQGGKHLAHLFN